jgi:hypothetical protein
VFVLPMPSTPDIDKHRMSRVAMVLLAAKSAGALAPRAVGAPALVNTGHTVFEKLFQCHSNRFNAVALASCVAFDTALPIVVAFATIQPEMVSAVGRDWNAPVVRMPAVDCASYDAEMS